MTKSITFKLYVIISILIIGLLLVSSFIVNTFLADYYLDSRLEQAHLYMQKIATVDSEEERQLIMTDMLEQLGGNIYYASSSGSSQGKGFGRGMNRSGGSGFLIPESAVKEYQTSFTNKHGVELYILAIETESDWLVYEIPIQSVEDIVGVVNQFYRYLLAGATVITLIIGMLISKLVTKPIIELNNQALQMKEHHFVGRLKLNRNDELGSLSLSLESLYNELMESIQRLEGELEREKALDSLRKKFVAQVSHELQTPIAAISGYAEILDEKIYTSDEEFDHYLQSVRRETDSMSRLVKDLLDLSVMESGQFQMKKEKVHVDDFHKNTLKKIKKQCLEQEHAFELVVEKMEGSIYIDSLRIEQALRNLLKNAFKYATGPVVLKVYRSGNDIGFKIHNVGKSIPEDELPNLFKSFYKGSGNKPGTGLGLRIVEKIVDYHKGVCWIQNTDNGVESGFKIPLVE